MMPTLSGTAGESWGCRGAPTHGDTPPHHPPTTPKSAFWEPPAPFTSPPPQKGERMDKGMGRGVRAAGALRCMGLHPQSPPPLPDQPGSAVGIGK